MRATMTRARFGRMMSVMTRRPAGIAAGAGSLLVAAVLVGSQVLASAGTPAPRDKTPSPAAATESGDDDCTTDDECGNEHSRAIRAWVACKAEKSRDACEKPTPPGLARGHAKRPGTAPGPAGADGRGHGWGRAHAPGQLKEKKVTSDDDGDEDDEPTG
jgi:hypothetical protein